MGDHKPQPDPIPDFAKPMLWVVGALEELRRLCLVDGPTDVVTPKGTAAWDQLDAGYAPSDQEVDGALLELHAVGAIRSMEMVCLLARLLAAFRDKREELERRAAEIKGKVLDPPEEE